MLLIMIINDINYNSVENLPQAKASVAFTTPAKPVFREDKDLKPKLLGNISFMPWGSDNNLPFDMIDIFEADETMATCAIFNTEIAYGQGLHYNSDSCKPAVADAVKLFEDENNFPEYFFGACSDLKMFNFCVSVIILSEDGSEIMSVSRREACYCRFAPADASGNIPEVIYANWRKAGVTPEECERIALLSQVCPARDLRERIEKGDKTRKFAILSKIPSADSTYYPIPYYSSLINGNWYNIKKFIGIAKEAKLKNSAPLKYQIEIDRKYWESIFRDEGITDKEAQRERVILEKQQIIEFLTGAENSGKVLFSQFYTTPDGKEQRDIRISKIDSTKEGGDWATDIQEAVNMICFTLRVHSNLVGSVPGPSNSNNSGSDKRELHSIAQAQQKPYRDIIFKVHRLIINYNMWINAYPECPFLELTTLDTHKSVKQTDCF